MKTLCDTFNKDPVKKSKAITATKILEEVAKAQNKRDEKASGSPDETGDKNFPEEKVVMLCYEKYLRF